MKKQSLNQKFHLIELFNSRDNKFSSEATSNNFYYHFIQKIFVVHELMTICIILQEQFKIKMAKSNISPQIKFTIVKCQNISQLESPPA